MGGRGWRLGRKVGANPAPKPSPRNAKRWGDGPPNAGLSRRGLAPTEHSPTAQWLPRGYILASTVSPAAGTGAAGPRVAWQRTSASRTNGSSRPRMVPTGSPWSARRGCAEMALPAKEPPQDQDLGGAPLSSTPLLQPPPGPDFIGEAGRGGWGLLHRRPERSDVSL